MNTLNYIGCKNKLFERLYNIFLENIPDLHEKTFSDLFMGTGIVSFQMLGKCRGVYANDLESYSYVIGEAILKCPYSDRLADLLSELNALSPVDGLIYKYYAPNDNCERMFFTPENARKADAIRGHLKVIRDRLSQEEYHFLLASLLVSIDRVANTACVYGAYLKKFKSASIRPLMVEPIHTNRDLNPERNCVSQGYAEETDFKADVTYLDPPYNQRSYGANYFVLNFICKYDASVIPYGKTGLIERKESGFCSKPKIRKAFEKLLANIRSRYILLSYNNEGLLKEEELREILDKKGATKLYKIKYNKFKAQKGVDGDFVYEYLWVVDTEAEAPFQSVEV